jgi:hypothetical protein
MTHPVDRHRLVALIVLVVGATTTDAPTFAPTTHHCLAGTHFCWRNPKTGEDATCTPETGDGYSCDCPSGFPETVMHTSHAASDSDPSLRHMCAATPVPSLAPSKALTGAPTKAPTKAPTTAPTASTNVPTTTPTAPTAAPTVAPTAAPTSTPTDAPTLFPTRAPTSEATNPTKPTFVASDYSVSSYATVPNLSSAALTMAPTAAPT